MGNTKEEIPTEHFIFSEGEFVRAEPNDHKKIGKPYFSGPIYVSWLKKAWSLGPSVFGVAIALGYGKGLNKSSKFIFHPRYYESIGMSRYTAYKGLEKLEQARLVKVRRPQKRAQPIVTLIKSGP